MSNNVSTINKSLIGFQRRKLLIVVACRDYNIVLKYYFAIKFHSLCGLSKFNC